MSESQNPEQNEKNGTIICFSGVDWWYHNGGLFCPQVMRRLSRNYRVLFINSLGMRVPSFKKDKNAVKKISRKLRSMSRFVRKVDHGMYVFSPLSLPFYGSQIGKSLNAFSVFLQVKLAMTCLRFTAPIFYIECPPALEVVKKFGKKYLIYQRTDLFEAMPGANTHYIAALDDELTSSADLVLYVNTALWKQGIQRNKNSLLIGHGVDFDFFSNAKSSKHVPEDVAGILRPIIGYFGDVSDKTLDMALLEFAAEKLPDMSFVFVGSISADVSGLSRFGNVHFLGQKPYEQIPLYGKEFDVAIMPWNRSRWIEFCNPIKIKEYLALGKPVVSTYYPEIEPYRDIVYVAADYEDFVSSIRKAVEERDPAKQEERRKRVQNETWDNKVEQIKAIIEKDLR
jgi:glycosyltransferase involved in cell wall biosynthesis